MRVVLLLVDAASCTQLPFVPLLEPVVITVMVEVPVTCPKLSEV